MSIFQIIGQFGSIIGDKINSAFDSANHGFTVLAGGGILALLIFGYIAVKVGKYV